LTVSPSRREWPLFAGVGHLRQPLRTQIDLVGVLKGLKATLEEADHATAALAVERVLAHNKIKMLQTLSDHGDNREQIVRSCFVALCAFEAEMTFLLSDTQ
jgi:hypothetical protein